MPRSHSRAVYLLLIEGEAHEIRAGASDDLVTLNVCAPPEY